MSFTIDKSIPIPADASKPGSRSKYPLDKMEPGDSFFVPFESEKQVKHIKSSMAARAKKLGYKIVSAADDTGVRIWRTA